MPATQLNVEFAEEQPISYASRRADALARVAEGYLQNAGCSTEARAGGGWRFSRPDGREFDAAYHPAPAQDWTALRDTHAALGIEIDSDTAATRWRGERMDYELGVWVLCQQHARAQHGHAHPQAQSEGADHEGADHDEVDPASNAANDVSAETPGWWAA